MPVIGVRGTGEFSTDFRPTNYRELFTMLEPNGDAPLNALMAMTNSQSTDDPKYNNFRDELPARTVQIDKAAGYAAGITTLQLTTGDDVEFIVEGTVLVNATSGEVMVATEDADTANDTIEVTRQIGGTSLAIVDDDELFVAGHAASEGGSAPSAVSFDPTVSYNYCQIFKTSYQVTETLKNTYVRTGAKEDEYATKALKMHMQDIERSMFFGQRHILNGSTSNPTRFTGGLVNTLTNVVDLSSANTGINADADVMTEDEFDRYLIENVFAWGSKQKIAFVGAKVAGHMQAIGKSRWAPTMISDTYGIKFTQYDTFAGELLVHLHPQFRQIPGMDDAAIIIDVPNIKFRHLQNRDTHLLENVQNNDADTAKHQYLSECGLELLQDRVHTYLKNWDGIS